ncbi:hypothetical protein [Ferrimonas senticii]|uniref:hypothetical protein n=1 Tax=Ferrimonas senticii TaxID=394566 RepID=UPI00041A1CEF|nr:hypothetical protein [Ferrimonas senticii]
MIKTTYQGSTARQRQAILKGIKVDLRSSESSAQKKTSAKELRRSVNFFEKALQSVL